MAMTKEELDHWKIRANDGNFDADDFIFILDQVELLQQEIIELAIIAKYNNT